MLRKLNASAPAIELRNNNVEFIERYTAITDSDCLPAYSYMATCLQSNRDLSSLDILLTPQHTEDPVVFGHKCRSFYNTEIPDENGFLRDRTGGLNPPLLTLYLGEYIKEEGGLSKFKNMVLETIRKNVKSKTEMWYAEERSLDELSIDRVPATNIRKEKK